MKCLTWRELVVAIILLGVLAVIFLPSLARSREYARRSSCQNNLKQWGLIAKMFANEHQGVLPPVSPVPNNWFMDMAAIYPEYLTDPAIAVCPNSPLGRPDIFHLQNVFQHPNDKIGQFHPDCVSSLFYIYTGYAVTSDAEAIALADALEGNVSGEADLILDVPIWTGQPAGQSTDMADPQNLAMQLSRQPVMWDRIALNQQDLNHNPSGANVLYLDGHVEFRKYGYYNAESQFPVTPVSAEVFSTLPALSVDCY